MLHKYLFKTQKAELLVNKCLLDEPMISYTSFIHGCSCLFHVWQSQMLWTKYKSIWSQLFCELQYVSVVGISTSQLAFIHKLQLTPVSVFYQIQTEQTLLRIAQLFGFRNSAENKSYLHRRLCAISSSTFPPQMKDVCHGLWACAIQRADTTSQALMIFSC